MAAVVRLSQLIARAFWRLWALVRDCVYREFWLKGGRASTKSSFISLAVIKGVMQDPEAHAVCFRKVADTLRDSVFEQLKWAIYKLGVEAYWDWTVSPMRMVYKPTGQVILFRGLDKVEKPKSLKISFGYFKYLWFEELTEFAGVEEIRNVKQSVIRGTDKRTITFASYNPPKNANNWVNVEVEIPNPDRYVHHSTYLDVPPEWLGEDFIALAEHTKLTRPDAYRHEYLGEVIGTGGQVFDNITLRKITDNEINTFDNLRRGIDWGYASDPFHYTVLHYDKTRRRIYIFYEIHKVRLKNRTAASLIKLENRGNQTITCDSAEPKSIDELRDYGLNVRGARKGPDSVEYGVKFLQDLEEIIIDPVRCPDTAREFRMYELEPDKIGGFKARYPDKNNHSIDAVRYALEDDMTKSGGITRVKL